MRETLDHGILTSSENRSRLQGMLKSKLAKYKMQHQLIAYKSEKNKYMKLLYVTKRDYLKPQFHDHKGNSKHIYKLMTKLAVGVSVNPILDSILDVELANEFANFFWNKIVKIRNEFDETSECFICPNNRNFV